MKKFSLLTLILLLPLVASAQQKAKYVFYFIGDGMGFNHVSLTEYWLGYTQDVFDSRPLSFSAFPVLGWAVTHSESNLITDSAPFDRKQDQERYAGYRTRLDSPGEHIL